MSNVWHTRIERIWREIESDLATRNSFGEYALHYRTVSYGGSLDRLERLLPSFPVQSPRGLIQPLRTLKLDEEQNWVVALLQSWSLVAEVLGFYQERMANEGFLASAVQEISVRELLSMVDYQSFPGTAATALPIFLTSGAKGMPEVVDIPKGVGIQGVPLGGSLPQIFQTTAPLGGRAEWNRMSAYVVHLEIPPPLRGTSRLVELAGFETSLKPGDPLLLGLRHGQKQPDGKMTAGTASPGEATHVLRLIEKAKRKKGSAHRPSASPPGSSKARPSRAGSTDTSLAARSKLRASLTGKTPPREALRGFDEPATEVTLTEALEPDATGMIELTEAFRFRKRARLFGYDAPKWSQVPDPIRRHYAPIQGGIQCSSDDGTQWRPADQGLPEVDIRCLAAAGPWLFAGTSKGLYRRADSDLDDEAHGSTVAGGSTEEGSKADDAGWTLCTNGIGRLQISALAILPGEESGDHVWVADSRGQVYQSADGGESYSPVQGRVVPKVAGLRALFKRAFGRLAKPLHLSAEATPRPTLPVGPVHALLARNVEDELTLFAGTDKGVFQFALPAGGWVATSDGLPGADAKTGQASTAVRALGLEKAGCLILGCDKGVYRSRDGGRSWHAAERGLPKGTQVLSLTGFTDKRRRSSTFFIGTESGIFRSDDPERGWSAKSVGLIDPSPDASEPPPIEDLSSRVDPVDLSHHIFAGTPFGLFRSTDGGESWGFVESLEPTSEIDAVISDRLGRVLVAMPFAGFATDEWPGFHLLAGAIDLDRVYDQVVAGGWVVLRQPTSEGGLTTATFQITEVTAIERQDFELDAMVTRLVVDDDGTLATFDLRATQVFLSSQALEPWKKTVADLKPICGSEIRVSPALNHLPESERRMIVTGRRSRVRPSVGEWKLAGHAETETTVGRTATRVPPASESLEVLMWKKTEKGHRIWGLDRLGRKLELDAEGLEWVAAEEKDEIVGQAVHVIGDIDRSRDAGSPSAQAPGASRLPSAASLEGEDFTTLTLGEPLTLWFDPTTVSVWGNAAPASQGQTVSHPIGSGDAARSLQRFTIDQPITYVSAATENGYRSTLEIEVAGAKWQQVPHLSQVGAGAHAYMVRPDLSGRPMVIFGDGKNGARLPSGRNNVSATYRSGMWTEELAPHQLSILQTRGLGLRHADNPLATEPGEPSEDRDDSRKRMPSWLRPLGRIVSERDFQDFVAQRPAIARALVAPMVLHSQGIIQITIAGQDGELISPQGDIYQQLVEAIAAQRAPGQPVRIQNYEPVHWLASLRLQIELEADKSEVAQSVRESLGTRFGFEQADFGQRIFVGQLADVAMSVPGVRAAEVLRFGVLTTGWVQKDQRKVEVGTAMGDWIDLATSAFEQAPAGKLEAKLARADRDVGTIFPAQLLCLAKIELELRT